MIKEGSDFFQNAKFCPIFVIYNSPADQHVQFCMNSKFDAFLQPVLRAAFMLVRLQGRNQVPRNENGINVNLLLDVNHKIGLKFLLTDKKKIPTGKIDPMGTERKQRGSIPMISV